MGTSLFVIHVPTVNGIDCPLFNFVSEELGDVVYGETGTLVEFRPTLLSIFVNSCLALATGNNEHICLNWTDFIPFVYLEIAPITEDLQ